ncbi:integrase, catalytic region, zinc finger, CCHC-type containing protein [Tanacetum coccineum]
MKNVFESMKSDLNATWKQNEILNDQLLEATLKHDVEKCVLMCNDFVNVDSLDEIEKTQGEIDELIEHVNQKTYAYADVHAQNQDLLIIIAELKAKLKNVEKGKSVNTKFDKPSVSGTLLCVTPINKQVFQKKRTNKKTNVASKKNVVQNNKIVTNVDVKNASKAKDVFCVSLDKNVLTPCHDKCIAKYKLNMHSNVGRALFTTPRTAKPKSLDTTLVVQIVMWIVDSGCSKHMTGDLSLLKNFVEKFMGTVCFGNDHFEAVTGHGDYVHGNITICHVYFVKGLGHNLFSVGQFCDDDLEVAFRSKIVYVRNLEGDDLLTGARESNLYTISISDMAPSSPVCLMSKATSTKSWYNKTPYELLRGRKLNVEYFHVFGSLCYPKNDREDLGKMKPKADMGIFVRYSESSRGFRIYNRRIRNIMETIHVKFDKLTSMASEHPSLEPRTKCFQANDSSAEDIPILTKEDLDNLFGPMFEEYFEKRPSEVSIKSDAQPTLNNQDTPSSYSIIVERMKLLLWYPLLKNKVFQTQPMMLIN